MPKFQVELTISTLLKVSEAEVEDIIHAKLEPLFHEGMVKATKVI